MGTPPASPAVQVRTLGKGKVRPCDVRLVGAAGALTVLQVLDPDDVQDVVGLGRTWALV